MNLTAADDGSSQWRKAFLLVLAIALLIAWGDDRDSFPKLLASSPTAGAVNVPRTAWIRLDFDHRIHDAELRFRLVCAGQKIPLAVSARSAETIILDPREDLPAQSQCALRSTDPVSSDLLSFSTDRWSALSS